MGSEYPPSSTYPPCREGESLPPTSYPLLPVLGAEKKKLKSQQKALTQQCTPFLTPQTCSQQR